MNLDELRSVQSKERQKDSLQNLRPSFYQEVGEYIADLEEERDRAAERADDPFSSPEVSRLTDEIETAKDVVEAIYERRMGKLVKQASLAAAGMAADDEGLTAEEADLFDDLVDRIGENKSRVLDVLEGVESESTADPGAAPESTVDRSGDSARDPAAAMDDSATRESRDEDAPPVPPQDQEPADEAPADPAAADTDAESNESGVSPADVMGGEPSSIDEGDAVDELGSESGSQPSQSAAESNPDPQSPSEPDLEHDPATEPGSPSGAATDAAVSAGTDGPSESPPGAGDADSESAADTGGNVDRTTVRITRDVGSILGIDDREYTLSSDDIVTLPEQNADPLVERDAAERLE